MNRNRKNILLLLIEVILIGLTIFYTEYIIIPIIAILVIILFGINIKINIFILIFFLSFQELIPGIDFGEISFSIIHLMLLLSLFYLFVKFAIEGNFHLYRLDNKLFYLILGFYFICILSISRAQEILFSIRYMRDLTFWIILMIYILYFIKSQNDLNYVVKIWLYSAVLVGMLAILQLFFALDFFKIIEGKFQYNFNTTYFRLNSTFRDPNFLSNYLIVPVIIGISNLWVEKNKHYWFLVFLLSAIILLTGSRGAIFSVLIGSYLIYFYTNFDANNKLNFIRNTSVFVIILIVFTVILPKILTLRNTGLSSEADWSSITRVLYIFISLGIIKANFLLGIGINNYPVVFKNYAPEIIWKSLTRGGQEGVLHGGGYSHNTFLTLWAETGILNAIIMILIIYYSIRLLFVKNYKYHSKLSGTELGIVVGFLSLMLHSLTITHLAYHTFLTLGLIIAIYRFKENPKIYHQ